MFVLSLWLGLLTARAQHSHLNAGAVTPTAGSPLYFPNGALFAAASGFALPLKEATNGPFAGYFRGSITFTALAATELLGGPAFGHAAPGAHLELRVESVTGPSGGRFVFWESQQGETGTELTFAVPAGTGGGTNQFALSENDGSPEADPYGHVHGRSFGATQVGLYAVGFRIVDTSANGPGGGPLHPPSELFVLQFQAGLTIAHVRLEEGRVDVGFVAPRGAAYQVESAAEPNGPWTNEGSPVVGTDHLETVSVAPSERRYFRLKVVGNG